jgi:hypothetical protein
MRDVSGLNAGSYAIFAFINGLSFSETNTDFILYGDDTTTLNHGWQRFRVTFFGIALTAGLVAN